MFLGWRNIGFGDADDAPRLKLGFKRDDQIFTYGVVLGLGRTGLTRKQSDDFVSCNLVFFGYISNLLFRHATPPTPL
jgi:hypothetical protein